MAENEGAVPESGSRRWFSEVVWLAPTVAVTAFLVVVVLNDENVEVLSAVVGTVLAMLGIVIAVVTFRLQARGQRSPWVLSRRAKVLWRVTSVVMTVVLAGLAAVWPLSDDDPNVYFGKDVLRVGINGKLPGWSEGSDTNASGFDVELARFLAEQYGIGRNNVVFVELNQSQREKQWTDPKRSWRVDIVISAFSITDQRLGHIDMAGPYYVDRSMSFGNANKPDVQAGDYVQGCAVKGTTGENRLASVSNRLAAEPQANLSIKTEDELATCYKNFFNPNTNFRYIASDWSIIQAFKPDAKITYADDPSERRVTSLDEPKSANEGREEYGVAIPEDHPNVCLDLADKIQQFLKSNWLPTFNETVGQRSLAPLPWHKPERVNKQYCETDGVLSGH